MLHVPMIDILFEIVGLVWSAYTLAHWYFHGKFKKKYFKHNKKRRIEMTRLK